MNEQMETTGNTFALGESACKATEGQAYGQPDKYRKQRRVGRAFPFKKGQLGESKESRGSSAKPKLRLYRPSKDNEN
jgi:hypothetical protein